MNEILIEVSSDLLVSYMNLLIQVHLGRKADADNYRFHIHNLTPPPR